MNISTFGQDLLGGFEDFADKLNKFIAVEHDYVEGGLVVALSSQFGSGKSTFLQMWASSLENADDQGEKKNSCPDECMGE
ncbi:KAP family P-loop domain-containing protein [Candidatus Electrothrix marina]|uniref:KAP family P-loop domain-containing protein n=1 Tax=Candidatus Electrothrix marina TaxID=1859130 RepID=A0A444JBT0_9BACT|nr:KAP family P-loop domain-containing protein [Candidatus Electrothrix marina]